MSQPTLPFPGGLVAIEEKDYKNVNDAFSKMLAPAVNAPSQELVQSLLYLFTEQWRQFRLTEFNDQQKQKIENYEDALFEYQDPSVLQLKRDYQLKAYVGMERLLESLGLNVYRRMNLNVVEQTIEVLKKEGRYKVDPGRVEELKGILYNKKNRNRYESISKLPKMVVVVGISGFDLQDYFIEATAIARSLQTLRLREK